MDAQYDRLSTDVLQFGFKKNSSIVICTSILLDTIEYYNENNTNCYLLLLDALKASDRVKYVKLFKMLKGRNMCPIVLRLLMNNSSCSNNIIMKPILQMRNGQKIPYVESCKHLGNAMSTVNTKF